MRHVMVIGVDDSDSEFITLTDYVGRRGKNFRVRPSVCLFVCLSGA